MKFVLTTEHTYFWPVTVSLPDPAKSGELIEQKFDIQFRAMPRDESDAFDAELAALPPEAARQRKHDLLKEIVLGWGDGVVDKKGHQVPFSAEALHQAMQMSWFLVAVYRAYAQSLSGDQARLGN